MLIEVDAAGLEWRTALFLSQDKVGIQEVIDGVDTHSENQKFFNLPERVIAKIFLFRAIYKGPAYAYANDPDFMGVSKSEKYWQAVIDKMYEKYYGLAAWHTKIIQEVNATGRLSIPTGRAYNFQRGKSGEYSVHDITNYPVQGLGSEFVAIARVAAYRRYQTHPLKDKFIFINTVHDSLIVDANVSDDSSELYQICTFLEDCFSDIPRNFELLFKSKVNIPMVGEVKYGNSWSPEDMKKFERKK